ncbi:hypothetical protein KSF73_01500 [Burkholderiaceae bacterium DAT-1]|nr:hypothetical protein [Burkholderiaceae bacterium DAT-1]
MNKAKLLALAASATTLAASFDANATAITCATAASKTQGAQCVMSAGTFLASSITIKTSPGVLIGIDETAAAVGICTAHVAGAKKFGLSSAGGTPVSAAVTNVGAATSADVVATSGGC